MRTILLSILLTFISCKAQNKIEELTINTGEFQLLIEGVQSVDSDSIEKNYIIEKKSNSEVVIKPLFLETESIDGKRIHITKGKFNQAKITFSYDGIFDKEEKTRIPLGLKKDTTIIVNIQNNVFELPKFKKLKSNINNEELIKKGFHINQDFSKKIISNPEIYGSILSPDYRNAIITLNKSISDFNNLEDLFVNIDYTQFTVELIGEKSNNKLIYQQITPVVFKKEDYYTNTYSLDLNRDGIKDSIFVYKNYSEKFKYNQTHSDLPIQIKKGSSEGSYTSWGINNGIIRKLEENCTAEGFQTIIQNEQNITVEQVFCRGMIYVKSYTTLKYEKSLDNFILYKYEEKYVNKQNPEEIIPSIILDSDKFGKVLFENISEEFFSNISL